MALAVPETVPETDLEKVASEPAVFPEWPLARKMAWVQGQVQALRTETAKVQMKAGGSYTYDYIGEGDLMAMIRPLLAEAGIAVWVNLDEVRRNGNLVNVRMSLTFDDGEAQRTICGEGDGTDQGDKALAKAQTTCIRYMLWKQFLVSAGDPTDASNENVERNTETVIENAAPTIPGVANQLGLDVITVDRIIRYATRGATATYQDIDGPAQELRMIGQLRAYALDPKAAEKAMRSWEAGGSKPYPSGTVPDDAPDPT